MAVCEHGVDTDSALPCPQCTADATNDAALVPPTISSRRLGDDEDERRQTRRNIYVLAFTVFTAVFIVAVVVVVVRGSGGPPHTAAEWCNSDAQAIATTVNVFDTEHPNDPIGPETVSIVPTPGAVTPGDAATYALATQAQRLLTGGYLSGWPNSRRGFSISLATTANIAHGAIAGDPMIYIGASKVPYDFTQQSPTSGCNSL